MGSYDTTIGTLLMGIFFNTFLYGLVTYQFAVYYRTKFNDRAILKLTVLFLFILDTFHSVSAIYMVWHYTVTNFGNPSALRVGIWPYAFTPIGFVLAALVTHIYLAIRIWRLTSSEFLYGITVLLAVSSFGLGMAASIRASTIPILSELPRITPLVVSSLSMQVVVDTFLTTTLVIVFTRSRTGFRRTDMIVNRLIRGAIQTGLFASLFSLGDLICFVVVPETNLFGMFAIPIGRIYTNTLLDTLLSREMLRRETRHRGDLTQSIEIDSMWSTPTDSQAVPTIQSTRIQLTSLGRTTTTDDSTCDHSTTLTYENDKRRSMPMGGSR